MVVVYLEGDNMEGDLMTSVNYNTTPFLKVLQGQGRHLLVEEMGF